MLQRLADAHLVQGHTIGIDATTLEANAAMRSIVRRDTGEEYEAWLTRARGGIRYRHTDAALNWPASTGSARRKGPTTTGRIPRIRTRKSRR